MWRWDFGDLSTVTVHIKRLRSKLGDASRGRRLGPWLPVAGGEIDAD